MNTDPVMKGLCIIQAKRTKNVVPFYTVSALAGVVEHKRAAKGILVTTSWFGRASEAFATITAAWNSSTARTSSTCSRST